MQDDLSGKLGFRDFKKLWADLAQSKVGCSCNRLGSV